MRPRRASLGLVLALLTAAGAHGAPVAPGEAEDRDTARLRREVERLRNERRLASGKGFYLRLDAARRTVSLMLQGVALDDYATVGLEWGVPEVFFVDREPPEGWAVAAFSKGRLEPERERDRIEIVGAERPGAPGAPRGAPSSDPSPSPPPVPRSAEESYSVPSPYRVVFAEGVSLEVRARGEGGRNRSLPRRLADGVSLRLSDLATALGAGSNERVRLRVTLEAEDAASLYRSLPPDVGLVLAGFESR